jgi:hypothetical protein
MATATHATQTHKKRFIHLHGPRRMPANKNKTREVKQTLIIFIMNNKEDSTDILVVFSKVVPNKLLAIIICKNM